MTMVLGGRLGGAPTRSRLTRLATSPALLCVAWTLSAQAAEPCAPALARVVSVQGQVELRRASAPWIRVGLGAALCPGDTVRVEPRSRAAVQLGNETTLRLDQGTVLTLVPSGPGTATLLQQLSGGLHVITRTPRAFTVKTPFVNANVEGTEFAVRVDDTGATVAVYEGVVLATNDAGSERLVSGEAATATPAAGAPRKDIVVRPADAVAWTLYFPAVLDFPSEGAGPSSAAARAGSVALYRSGRITEALAALGQAPEGAAAAGFLTYRAALLLLVGRLDEARPDIAAALRIDPRRSDAHALLSVIALVENDADQALERARQAVELDPASPGALMALSYAQQARFEIEPALASVLEALRHGPSSALAHARRAELEMSSGRLDAALAAAQQAVQLNPALAKTQTVLGFANLVRIDTGAARASFERAIELDQADPLPRLGLGLAKIRAGDLAGGRAEIEIAAILAPLNSIVRSYLGKAYFDEKRDPQAAIQFALAKERDPRDPTPHFYDAVRELAGNLPIDAVRDLGQSVALNDNRAVYRSRLLLDQDQAARMISLARTYRTLGFDQLALLEALKSLSLDAGDSSAHRFLADAYTGQVRTEAVRVSELLQSQLRQPIGLNTLQPQQLADRQLVVEGAGPVQASSHEFAPLFSRNQVLVNFDGLVGGYDTVGDQLFVTALADNVAFSLGQYHHESSGLRPNNDSARNLYSAFVHLGLTPSIRVQAELRDDRTKQGDLSLRFDPDNFSPVFRDDFQQQTARLGGIVVLDPSSSLVMSAIAGRAEETLYSTLDPLDRFEDRERFEAVELQHMVKGASFQLSSGLSFYKNRTVLEDSAASVELRAIERNLYVLATFTGLPWGIRPQLGASYDRFEEAGERVSRVNPRLGLLWPMSADTTLRAAYFRTIKRTFVTNQTLQPSQIAGFNLYYDDPNGTLSRRAGVGVHHRLSDKTFLGAEWSARDLQVPGYPGDPYSRWTERFGRAYLYGILSPRSSVTAEWQYEQLRRPEENTGNERFTDLRTMFLPVALRWHWPATWSVLVQATLVDQKARHENPAYEYVEGSDRFVVVDASLSHQLPKRAGTISLEARNLFDQRFRYQEIDVYSSPRVSPRRLLLLRLSASF
jgi:tetratricopeptide (TPR) repeat protein